jgi:hydroxyacylglutathione hydrolase
LDILIETIPVTLYEQNCRIIYSSGGKEALLIDPGGEAEKIIDTLNRLNLKCTQVWLTHSHVDHIGALKEVVDYSGASVYGSAIEREMRTYFPQIARKFGLDISVAEPTIPPEPDHYLVGSEELVGPGGEVWKVLFTPGHSPGHLCYYQQDRGILLAGDVLFKGSVGRTDLPGGNQNELMKSIKDSLMVLPDNVKVLSGHGPNTSIGVERDTNPFRRLFT